MALENGTMSPADFRALMNDGDGFGDGNAWWWIILLFILWGGNGFGNGANNVRDYLQTDVATLERKMDGLANGLCDGFYTQAQLVNNTNMNLANGFANAELSRATGQTALVGEINGLSRQLSDCCCTNRYDALVNANATQKAISDGFCATNYNNSIATRDIIEAQNSNTRAILDELQRQNIEAKDTKIAEQNQMLFAYQLQASQSAQTNQLIGALNPTPIPAYYVPNPYAYSGCNGCCNG